MNIDKKNDKRMDNALNECFESMVMKGESLDSCLMKHPEHALELKPLLETMQAARSAGAISPEPAFREAARHEFRKALYEQKPIKVQSPLSLRWATMAAGLGVFVLTSAGGAVAASSSSMPGQILYQVKRNVEDVQLTLAPTQAGKARVYATLADRRISELVYSAESGNVQLTENLTQQFTGDLGMVYQITAAERGIKYSGDSTLFAPPAVAGSMPEQSTNAPATTFPGSKGTVPYTTSPATANTVTLTGTASPPVTTASPTFSVATPPAVITQSSVPAPTIVITQQPAVTITTAVPSAAPIITITQPTVNLSGVTDPVLLKLLQQYSVKNVAQLMAVLDSVPPSTKAAILAALKAATSAYGQILGA
jgi:hypothetical protein